MQKAIITGAVAIALGAIASFAAGGGTMKITSSAFSEGGMIPDKYAKQGQNVNPPLRIEGAPAETKSLLLIVDDPDAPMGLFTHWLVWNIDPKTTEIADHSLAKGAIRGTTDFPGCG